MPVEAVRLGYGLIVDIDNVINWKGCMCVMV